jgi:hypothetical protein
MKAVPPRIKVEPIVDETGRRRYPGSIGMQYFDLTTTQKAAVMKQLKAKPCFASDVVVPDSSPYDPSSAEAVRRYLGELVEDKRVEMIRDSKNKNLGWKAVVEKPEGE